MTNQKKLVIIISNGLDNERASVAWSLANAAANSDMELTVFLVSNGVEWARKGAADFIQLNPVDPPIKNFIDNVIESGANIGVCPPCAKLRGYSPENFIDAAHIVGPDAVYGPVQDNAAVLTF